MDIKEATVVLDQFGDLLIGLEHVGNAVYGTPDSQTRFHQLIESVVLAVSIMRSDPVKEAERHAGRLGRILGEHQRNHCTCELSGKCNVCHLMLNVMNDLSEKAR